MKKYINDQTVFSTLVLLGCLVVSYFLLKTYSMFEDRALNQYLQGRSRSVVDRIEESLEQRILSVDRMAKRHTEFTKKEEKLWKKDAIEYRQDIKAISHLALLDSNFNLKWASPKNSQPLLLLKEIKNRPNFQNLKSEVALAKQGLLASTKVSKKKYLISLHPTFVGNYLTGYVLASYPMASLFGNLLDHSFHIKLSLNGKVVYDQVRIDKYKDLSLKYAHNFIITVRNVDLHLMISPSVHLVDQEITQGSMDFLYALFTLLSFLAFLFIYVQIGNRKALIKEKMVSEKALKSRMRFFSNMSHEIRTPLNGVLGINSFLMDHEKDFEKIKQHQTIEKSGKTLLALINDILDFSRLETNKISFEIKSLNLRELIQEVKELLDPIASEKGLSIEVQVDSKVPKWVQSDPSRLRQVITNLTGNSIKFTKKGTVFIKVEKQKNKRNQENLLFSVIDSGIGIPHDKVKIIFDPFTQANDSTTRGQRGTGLGLAISKHIIDMAGGRVWVEDTSKGGTTICFEIPMIRGQEVKKVEKKEIDVEMGHKSPLSILVAEDDAINREVVKMFLNKIKYEPDFALDGSQVLTAVSKKSYDIVLMDCHMPIMDGFAASRELCRLYPKEKRPVIVALTASAMVEDRKKCEASGMDGFIAKPLNIEKLVEALQKIIDKKY